MAFKLVLATIRSSRTHTVPVNDLIQAYLRRCGRSFSLEAKAFRTEAAMLALFREEQRHGGIKLWIADADGQGKTSEVFAKRVQHVRENGTRHLLLAVGPADGWSAEARAVADMRLSLGSMTLPHELAALILAEQIYRASTILEGHPYHLGH